MKTYIRIAKLLFVIYELGRMKTLSQRRFGQVIFAILSLCFCLLLSFREISLLDSADDTGRYVELLSQFCAGVTPDQHQFHKELSFLIFHSVFSFTCYDKSYGLFLFSVAALVPLTLFLFSRWHSGTVFWAASLLFSVYGLELMTNALRQSFAMMMFFGAISFMHTRPKLAVVTSVLSAIAHSSVLFYIPLLLWMSGFVPSKSRIYIAIFFLTMCTILFVAINGSDLLSTGINTQEQIDFYTTIYEEYLDLKFLIFISSPLFFIYGLRATLAKNSLEDYEKKAMLYSTLLIAICVLFFPSISYRFAIFSVALQIFLVTNATKPSLKTGVLALIGMALHLGIFLYVSDSYASFYN